MGSPTLRQRSLEVNNPLSDEIKILIQDLKDIMKAYNGVGIAAPQIGINKRVIIFGFDKNPRYPDEKPVPFTVLINPVIDFIDNRKVAGWEGCLSVPGLRGKIERNFMIKYSGFDENGERIERVVDGFHARIIQHECDHLNGILYPDRLMNPHDFGFEDTIQWRGK